MSFFHQFPRREELRKEVLDAFDVFCLDNELTLNRTNIITISVPERKEFRNHIWFVEVINCGLHAYNTWKADKLDFFLSITLILSGILIFIYFLIALFYAAFTVFALLYYILFRAGHVLYWSTFFYKRKLEAIPPHGFCFCTSSNYWEERQPECFLEYWRNIPTQKNNTMDHTWEKFVLSEVTINMSMERAVHIFEAKKQFLDL
eukprot:snap_masked-scaffold_3-processed-gene-9.23-mRNA-1 protein AED:1.00 eAED:1.00 QI:0/0/0/0/1/1/2/0/203